MRQDGNLLSFGAKMAEGESAEKYLLNMSELWDRLAAVELPVPEEFPPLMILASLPASYTAIVQTLGSQAGKLNLVARDQYDHG